MSSNSGGSLTRPIFVLGLGIIFGAVISFLTKRKKDQIEKQVSQSEIVQASTNETSDEPVGCCGGGSCGPESNQPVEKSACGTVGAPGAGGCGTGACSTGNEISKVQKIHFLIGSKTGAASKFANDVHNYIQAFNTTIKCIKSDIDSGRFSEKLRNYSLTLVKCNLKLFFKK